MKENNKNKGITLIALVVTIVVILLLVGVTLSSLFGEDSLINQTTNAKKSNNLAEALEIVKMAVQTVQLENKQKTMTRDDISQALETETENISGDEAKVEYSSNVYLEEFRGYLFEISDDFSYAKRIERFDAKKWDSVGITPESAFFWKSEDPNDGELYHTIIGYKESLMSYPVVKVPSRCQVIDLQYTSENNSGRMLEHMDVNRQISRVFNDIFAPGRSELGGITKVELPETVTKLSGAFAGFSSLEEINLPYTLTEITGASFYGCSNLKKVDIPSRVKKIGGYSFYYCNNLEEINFSNSIESIEQYAFYGTKWYENLGNGEIYIGKVFYNYKGTCLNHIL